MITNNDGSELGRLIRDSNGDLEHPNGIICQHGPGAFRVGYDWGELKVFRTLDEALEFLDEATWEKR